MGDVIWVVARGLGALAAADAKLKPLLFSLSMNLPPPPGPPGMYFLFLWGGSEATNIFGGRPRRRPVDARRGVLGLCAMESPRAADRISDR